MSRIPSTGLEQSRSNQSRTQTLVAFIFILLLCLVVAGLNRIQPEETIGAAGNMADRVLKGIDINEADWPEIAQLPGFGERLSRRVVATKVMRQESQLLSGEAFKTPADLRAVSGIGRKTQSKITPYVRFSGGRGLD